MLTVTLEQLSEISSATSVLPGTLVQGLITNVHTSGLNIQVLGYFDGTIDEYHIGEESSAFKIGRKVRARVIYDYSSSPPRFALSLTGHVTRLTPRLIRDDETEESVRETYPVGTILEAVKVLRVEPERGLAAEISENVQGFVHVSSSTSLCSLST
jgi:rRNA biogenesis protein RRP5